ncbi:TonB-dependent receptor [Parahaliea sp. F7430]|uniref:TonB-dependent receptor n=1 Tax=Sediminihaliea albiluteola TaxID=2758564 RepID=A0A7W2TWF2_9GAMM|nr:TonB-dependent receptor [Sediminihaliea albiluteola]MBA6413205.1 TonB-dependent receptor [Sediminihaliea albiluteola]
MTIKKNGSIAALVMALGVPAGMYPAFSSAAVLEEVVVTARKREESMQQTPISITALTSESMERAGINELTAIDRQTPNLTFTVGTGGGSSTVNAFIRGVGENDFIITTDPTVGLYLDGVYLARVFGANMELKDVERIEVLRGPQGTLFGKNSIGGAISVSTRKPDGSTEGELNLTAGSRNLRGLSLYGQTALTDTLSASVSYLQKDADGWQSRPGGDAGDTDLATARVILNWAPSDDFESSFSADWNKQDQNGYPNVMLSYRDGSVFGDLWNLLNPDSPCCTPNSDIDRSGAQGPLANDDVEGFGFNWTNTWQLSSMELKSITAYREMDALFGRDGDNSAYNYTGDSHDLEHRQFSQELQLTGDIGRLDWVAGLYYFEEKSINTTDLVVIEGIGVSVSYDNVQETSSYAAYAQLNYALTDRLDVYGGIRYTLEEKDFQQQVNSLDFGTPYVFQIPGLPVNSCDYDVANSYFDCSQDWSNTSPKLGLSYQLSDDIMSYAHVSRGFRSGGYNGRAFGSAADLQEYEPEILTSYEAGIKAELLDRSLRVNGSVFYNDYEDIQVLITRAGSVAVENASSASISGFELETTWLPGSNWQIQAGLGYLKDDSDGWVDVTGDYSDTELKQTPKWTFNLAADYHFSLGDMGTLMLRGDMKYSSDYYLNAVNTEELRTPSHTFYNASMVYTAPSERWELALQGYNLSDKRVLNAGFDGAAFFGFVEGSYNPPRSYSLNFKYRM